MRVLELGDAPPLGRRGRVAADARLVCSARGARAEGLQPDNDSPSSTSTCARPKGRASLLDTRSSRERIAREIRDAARRRAHADDDRQRPAADAQPGEHLRAPRRPAPARTEPVRRSWIGCGKRSSRISRKDLRIDVSLSAQISTGQSSAQVQYTISGPDLTAPRAVHEADPGALPEGAGRGRRRLEPDRRQSRGPRERRSRARGEPRRRRGRRRQHAAAAGRRAQGLDVPGGRRGLRHPRARRARYRDDARRAGDHDGADARVAARCRSRRW